MAGTFQDSPGKQGVRDYWNTPLLQYLHDTYGFRYRYFGLPGVDCLDIKAWSTMIRDVVAFEIAAPGHEERKYITALRENLRLLGKPFVAYYGPFEFVVLQRRDWDNEPYVQDSVVTLYNLDFCDEIGSKVHTREEGDQRWRFEAIRQLLLDQRESYRLHKGPSWFVFLITIRNQMDASVLSGFLADARLTETTTYRDECQGNNPLVAKGLHTWGLKAFLYDTLCNYLAGPNISALFFPLVKYTGASKSSPMLHWMIFCQFGRPDRAVPDLYPHNFLKEVGSQRVSADGHAVELEPGELNSLNFGNAVDWFKAHADQFILPNSKD